MAFDENIDITVEQWPTTREIQRAMRESDLNQGNDDFTETTLSPMIIDTQLDSQGQLKRTVIQDLLGVFYTGKGANTSRQQDNL